MADQYICYIDKNMSVERLAVVDIAEEIIDEYSAQGYDLTLRQLYYQFVARDLLPNTERSYNRLGDIISDARLLGLIPWDAIVDRTREIDGNSHWSHPTEIVEASAEQFRFDLWEHHPVRPEVWVEKEALAGVVERTARDLDVDFFSCRGYVSQSALWAAGQRLYKRFQETGQRTLVLHLGDHDPSGIDMTRDNSDRLNLFTFATGAAFHVRRIALNMDQIEELNPPTNPAKITDSRAREYIKAYGRHSWELDALEPRYLAALIRRHVEAEQVPEVWRDAVTRQDNARAMLADLAAEAADRWGDA